MCERWTWRSCEDLLHFKATMFISTVWEASIKEKLVCEKEPHKTQNRYAIAVGWTIPCWKYFVHNFRSLCQVHKILTVESSQFTVDISVACLHIAAPKWLYSVLMANTRKNKLKMSKEWLLGIFITIGLHQLLLRLLSLPAHLICHSCQVLAKILWAALSMCMSYFSMIFLFCSLLRSILLEDIWFHLEDITSDSC